MAPAGTPRAVIVKLNSAIDRILATDEVRRKLAALGVEAVGGSPEVFAAHVRAESEKWGRLVKTAGITVN